MEDQLFMLMILFIDTGRTKKNRNQVVVFGIGVCVAMLLKISITGKIKV
ncbi:hypothetical protein JOD18_000651 [Gracilibacillus alcaliphilus]|nr:hypothetical protein [Gracilibacillus alcaliphilus]